jgi:CheY-like chemotaxis protein
MISHRLNLLNGLKIEIVEDNSDTREALASFLRDRGAIVFTCLDATEAIQTKETQRPDLILCDIVLPGRDGFQLLYSIRLLDARSGEATRVIGMTAMAVREYRERMQRAGFQGCLLKPFTPDQLLKTISSVLSH